MTWYVLDDDTVAALCGSEALACTRGSQVFSSAAGYVYRRHELVHARLIGIMGLNSIPLFDEGVAAAMDRDGGCRDIPNCDGLDH